MKKILLIYAPFCTPASPPYSIANLYSFLKSNSENSIEMLDLNLMFHKLKFPEYQKYFRSRDWKDYEKTAKDFLNETKEAYHKSNTGVVRGEKPELFKELLKEIENKKPDIVVFSIVYSSQVFYAYSLIKELNMPCIVGGPAVNEKLEAVAKHFKNEKEFLGYLGGDKSNEYSIDFSIFELDEYFTPEPIIPIKTSSSCPYKKCTFCTHFQRTPYHEMNLDFIKKTIINSGQKRFFLIDDTIPEKRLLELAKAFKPLNIKWACQLRPTKELSRETLKTLSESGLSMAMWGIESGCSRILGLINKGTCRKDMEQVLQDSHDAGMKNIAYLLFGFPTETKEEFLETIDFLEKNKSNIDLVNVSVFGLQKNTAIYNNPEKFGISKIIETERTILSPRIDYEVSEGLTAEQAKKLRSKYKRTIEKIGKYPKQMNFFREHMFCLC